MHIAARRHSSLPDLIRHSGWFLSTPSAASGESDHIDLRIVRRLDQNTWKILLAETLPRAGLMYWCIYLFPSSSHNSEPSPLRMKTGNGAVCSNVRVFPPGRLSRDSLCRRWDSGWRSTNRVTASRRAESIFDMAWWLKSLWDIMHVGYILWLYMSGEIPRADGRSGWSV